jgi:hypothetical protein
MNMTRNSDQHSSAQPVGPVMAALSAYMSEARDRALPADVVEKTKHHVLDTFAAMISGAELAPGHAAIGFARGYGGAPVATVAGSDMLCGPIEAALANGVLAHADETDDSHAPSLSHPGCAVVPAALAVGELNGIDGTHFVRAVALGYDIGPRVTMCLGVPALSREAHKSSHSIAGAFGAAAAAGCAAGLDVQQMRWLIDYTAQQSSGIAAWQRDSDHIEKAFVFGGMPARSGVTAALLVRSGWTGIDDILHQAMVRIDARLKNEHTIGGVETGFTDLDHITGGLHESELVILAARPSMGKTALALNIAEYAALTCGVTTLFVSLEMSALELADRLLCSCAEINGHRLRNGTISNEDRRRLVEKAAELSRAPLFVDDSPSRTMTEIAATARRLKRKSKLGLIVIDYLQLIEPDNQKDPRQEQVARIARRLKGMARELKVPVMCLAQLNRQAEVSKENRPRLSHLRESGAIEQDADVVMFVHREEYYQTNEEDRSRVSGQADIMVAKQRNGPTGDIKLVWRHEFTRFANAAPKPYEELAQFNEDF